MYLQEITRRSFVQALAGLAAWVAGWKTKEREARPVYDDTAVLRKQDWIELDKIQMLPVDLSRLVEANDPDFAAAVRMSEEIERKILGN